MDSASGPASSSRPLLPYLGAIGALHLAGGTALLLASRTHPALVAMALVAYSLGLRHAFDADHLAAIDNGVRRMVERGRDPSGAGFFFSLGHSSVVFAMAVVTAVAAREAHAHLPGLARIGGRVGPVVSGVFLLGLGAVNAHTWLTLWRQHRRARAGFPLDESADATVAGPLWRLVAPFALAADRPWRLYPVGLLFGLGFDTASEVSLLALSSTAASRRLPWVGVLALPLLFAAGMTLLDTLDGAMMARVYRSARRNALDRLRYNLAVTGLSVVAAVGIGGIELGQSLAAHVASDAAPLRWLRAVDLGAAGYVLVLAFAAVWGLWAMRSRAPGPVAS